MSDERPLCKCHGESMHKNGGGYWRCAIKRCERERQRYEVHREKILGKQREWRANNPDKVRERNSRRFIVAGMYLGTFGFTDSEREKLLEVANGKAD